MFMIKWKAEQSVKKCFHSPQSI